MISIPAILILLICGLGLGYCLARIIHFDKIDGGDDSDESGSA